MVEMALNLYQGVLEIALPIACVFEIANLLVGMFLRAAFGGKLWLGGR